MLENTSEESEDDEDEKEEEDELDFNGLMKTEQSSSTQNVNTSGNSQAQTSQVSALNFYQKFKAKSKEKPQKQVKSKLAKKGGRNRLIRSMQNLAQFRSRSRSRSPSTDSMTSNEINGSGLTKSKSKSKISEGGQTETSSSAAKSDFIKSIFVNKCIYSSI